MLDEARVVLPAKGYEFLELVVDETWEQSAGELLSVSILLAVWTASIAVRTVMSALNAAYVVKEARPRWKRYLLSILYTLGFAVLVAIAAVLAFIGPQPVEWVAERVGVSDAVATLWQWVRWPAAVVLFGLTVAIAYYLAPSVRQPFRMITPGSVVAVVGWVLASLGFSFYVSDFEDYGVAYGSLGGAIVLLLYFYITAVVFLFGANLNAAISYETREAARPVGPPRLGVGAE
jgi:membrane protein